MAEIVCYIYFFHLTWPISLHYTLLKADVLNFYLTLDLLQSHCSDLVSKWIRHTVATTFLLRSHCQTCTVVPGRVFLSFNRTLRTQHCRFPGARETRDASSSKRFAVHRQFWADLSWQLINLLNRPYFSLLCANSVVRYFFANNTFRHYVTI